MIINPMGALTRARNLIDTRELETGLTPADLQRLTLFKWLYKLESEGFTAQEAVGITYYRWLYARGRIGGAL